MPPSPPAEPPDAMELSTQAWSDSRPSGSAIIVLSRSILIFVLRSRSRFKRCRVPISFKPSWYGLATAIGIPCAVTAGDELM